MSVANRFRAAQFVAAVVGWARRSDAGRRVQRPGTPGWVASAWAALKLGVVGLLSPLWAPAVMVRAAANHRRARRLIGSFPQQVRSIARRRAPEPPANRVVEMSAATRMVVFSDLHRCVPGRIDWPDRQGTKRLYELVLHAYDDGRWTLCENGDVEDYWMVGGSTYGAAYDAMRIAGTALAAAGEPALLVELYRAHLDEIVANNDGIYRTIRERFASDGRYVRTVGNHDDPIGRPMVADRLRQHVGDVDVGDYVALRDDRGELVGIVAHGHHTDGWNAPERDNLGKLSSWISNTLVDVPRLSAPEGLPAPGAPAAMREGRFPNRLISVHPTFGANAEYDSLDEELLWDAVRGAGVDDVWIILGHTHFPLLAPRSRTGERWTRYANSGSGVSDGVVTAVEWDGTGTEPDVRLVAWTLTNDVTPDEVTVEVGGERLARWELEPDGDRLRPRVGARSPAP